MKIYVQYETTELQTDEFRELDEQVLSEIMGRFKSSVELCLQPIKGDIEAEKGTIVLNENGTIELRGFSDNLIARINELLSTIN